MESDIQKHLKSTLPIDQLREVMMRLRAPDGCPWDREQNHESIRFHAVEEVYELIDAIEAQDDIEMLEELGDVLLQVIFHSRLAEERKAFDFDDVASSIVAKLIRRHPHVFTDDKAADDPQKVVTQWEIIKSKEKAGTSHQRDSALDGIPIHLPALSKVEKLIKKAKKSGILPREYSGSLAPMSSEQIADQLFELCAQAQAQGWSPEELLREKFDVLNRKWRALE